MTTLKTNNLSGASIGIFRDDHVLLVQRARAPFKGCWSFPGGRREIGETAEQCAQREVFEETGLITHGLVLVETVPMKSPAGTFDLSVFTTRSFSGQVVPNDEIEDWRWVRRDKLEALSTTPDLAMFVQRANAVSPERE